MITPLYGAAVLLTAGLVLLCIVSARGTWRRAAGVMGFAVFCAMTAMAYADLLSRPKPVAWEFSKVPEAQILGAVFDEGKAIYIWLSTESAPRYYVFPWDKDLAEEIQEALRQGERDGTGAMLAFPFEHSWDDRKPKAYPIPQPALPDKSMEAPAFVPEEGA